VASIIEPPVEIKEDSNMNSKRQFILNTFKQGHLIQIYEGLNAKERYTLMNDLELITFDMVDLVSIHSY